jgi:hypothetical protein
MCEMVEMRRGLQRLTGVQVSLLLLGGIEELPLGVEALGNILEDSVALPDDFIIVRVVDKRGDAPIGVEFAILLGLVLLLGEVEDDFTKVGY